MANSIQYDYKILDRYSAPLKKITKQTGRFNAVAQKAAAISRRVSAKFDKMGQSASKAETAIGGLGITAALGLMVKKSFEMEDAMANIAKVSDFSGASLAALREKVELLSEDLGRPAVGIAKIMEEAKKMNVGNDQLVKFARTVASVAVAFDTTEEIAGADMASIKAKLGLSMDQLTRFSDASNHLANTVEANGSDMIEITKRLSKTMKTLRVPPEAVAGFAAFANIIEVSPERAASGFNMMIKKMMVMPGMMDKLLVNPAKAIQDQMGVLAKMPEAKRVRKVFKMFGQEAGSFVLGVTSNLEKFESVMKTAMSPEAVGSVTREMDNYMARSSTKWKKAVSKLTNSFADLGETLSPIITRIAKVVAGISKMTTNFATSNPVISKLVGYTLALVGAFAAAAAASMVLLPVLAAISWPLVALSAGALAVAGAFTYWSSTSHPVIERLQRINKSLFGIIEAILPFIFNIEKAGKGTSDFSKFMSGLGTVLNIILAPLEAVAAAIRSIVEAFAKLVTLDIGGAFSALTKGGQDVMSALGITDALKALDSLPKIPVRGPSASGQMVGRGGSFTPSGRGWEAYAKTRSTNQNVNVGGKITVSAEKGSKVTGASSDLNTGTNMEFSY